MKKSSLKSLIIEQNEEIRDRDPGYRREALDEVEDKLEFEHILVITGPRRAGKSTLLVQIIENFLEDDSFYYLNFDDERLINFGVEDFNHLYELFIEIYGKRDFMLFDEIQNIENWEAFVNRMHRKGYKIILTGSNANLLSKELSTRLTGRYLDIELYPFSFKEFLRVKGVKVGPKDQFITERRAKLKNLFDEYLETGGFPERVIYEEGEILQKLYQGIVARDIITRHQINKTKTFKEIAMHLMSNCAKFFSYNSLKNNYDINSVNTAKKYVSYLEEAFLMFELEKYSRSVKKQRISPKKIYSVDTGLANSVSFKSSKDFGRLLENLVFIELKRRGKEVYYHKANHECDFLIKEGEKPVKAIQVTTELTEENREREIGGIKEAMETYELDNGLILTYKEGSGKEYKTIEVRPVWKWLLGV